jgi:hypothetical protein
MVQYPELAIPLFAMRYADTGAEEVEEPQQQQQ